MDIFKNNNHILLPGAKSKAGLPTLGRCLELAWCFLLKPVLKASFRIASVYYIFLFCWKTHCPKAAPPPESSDHICKRELA